MNHYSEAIKILSEVKSSNSTAIKMMFEIARKNPSIVNKAYDAVFSDDIGKKIIAFQKEGNEGKIACIKRYRSLTGAGLKDSKEAVERIISDNTFRLRS